MKKILVVLAVLSMGVGSLFQMSCSGPTGSFEKFATEWAHGRTDVAMAYTDGEAVRKALQDKSVNRFLGRMMQAVMKTETRVESEDNGPGSDEVTIKAQQVVHFNPPGVESAMRATMFASFRHEVVMKKTDGEWKVVSFKPELVKVAEKPR